LLVAVILLFDTIHQILIAHTLYVYTVTNYGNPLALGQLVWSLLVEVLFNGFIALFVQLFLTMRIWRLSERSIPLTVTVLFLVFSEFGCIIAYSIKSLSFTTFAEITSLKRLSITVNALAALGDVLIAAALCYLLHSSRTGFQRSDTIINKLIVFAVNTGLLTSICAVASLISITVAGNTFVYICFFFVLGRLYSNSLLATLNARQMIRAAADHTENLSLSMKDMGKTHSVPAFQVGRASTQLPTQISIRITNTQEYARDGEYMPGASGHVDAGQDKYQRREIDPEESSQITSDREMGKMEV
jgi:hypothetical protein